MYSETKVIVRYVETDKMGIVHHSVYPIWYELARTEFVKKAGMTYSYMESQGVMTPLVELNSRYIYPADYEDELLIKTKIGRFTAARIIFEYEIYKGEQLINTGSTMHALTNNELRPINIKKEKPEMYKLLIRLYEEEGKVD